MAGAFAPRYLSLRGDTKAERLGRDDSVCDFVGDQFAGDVDLAEAVSSQCAAQGGEADCLRVVRRRNDVFDRRRVRVVCQLRGYTDLLMCRICE